MSPIPYDSSDGAPTAARARALRVCVCVLAAPTTATAAGRRRLRIVAHQWGSIKDGVHHHKTMIAGHVPAVTNTSYQSAFHALEALSACIFVLGIMCVCILSRCFSFSI